jgi:FeS assembly SUF system regulator
VSNIVASTDTKTDVFMRLTLKEAYICPLSCFALAKPKFKRVEALSVLKISKLSDYATVVLARMAQLSAPESAATLAADTRLSPTTVAKLLKQLAKSGLVSATRGVNGGYQLTRAPGQISVAHVLAALEGPLGLTECTAHGGNCLRAGFCGTKSHWRTINQAVIAALQAVTLADLAAPPWQSPVPQAPLLVRAAQAI